MSAQAAPPLIRALKVFIEAVGPDEVLEICKHLFHSERTAEILMEFFKHEELTAPHLLFEHGCPEASIHRVFARLKELDIIEPVRYHQRSRKGGRRTQIWRLRRIPPFGKES